MKAGSSFSPRQEGAGSKASRPQTPHTFVAEVVLAASSIAGGALGAGAAGLVWGLTDPVASARMGETYARQTTKYPSKPWPQIFQPPALWVWEKQVFLLYLQRKMWKRQPVSSLSIPHLTSAFLCIKATVLPAFSATPPCSCTGQAGARLLPFKSCSVFHLEPFPNGKLQKSMPPPAQFQIIWESEQHFVLPPHPALPAILPLKLQKLHPSPEQLSKD